MLCSSNDHAGPTSSIGPTTTTSGSIIRRLSFASLRTASPPRSPTPPPSPLASPPSSAASTPLSRSDRVSPTTPLSPPGGPCPDCRLPPAVTTTGAHRIVCGTLGRLRLVASREGSAAETACDELVEALCKAVPQIVSTEPQTRLTQSPRTALAASDASALVRAVLDAARVPLLEMRLVARVPSSRRPGTLLGNTLLAYALHRARGPAAALHVTDSGWLRSDDVPVLRCAPHFAADDEPARAMEEWQTLCRAQTLNIVGPGPTRLPPALAHPETLAWLAASGCLRVLTIHRIALRVQALPSSLGLLVRLAVFRCTYCGLAAWPHNVLEHMRGLVELDLSNNGMMGPVSMMPASMPGLQHLSISENFLDPPPAEALQWFRSIAPSLYWLDVTRAFRVQPLVATFPAFDDPSGIVLRR